MGFPVTGGFNTTPSYTGTFIPNIWSSKLNAKFYTATVFGEIANTDWEGDIKGKGDKVEIRVIPTMTTANYTVGMNLNYEVPTPDKITLNIDKGRYFAFKVSDVLEHQSDAVRMNAFSDDAGKQMAIAIDSTVLFNNFNKAAAANVGATAGLNSGGYNLGTDAAPVVLTGANVLEKILALASVMDEQNVPDTDRWLVIDPITRMLLLTSPLAQAQLMGDATSPVRNGKIGVIDRFTVYVSNNLPRGKAGFGWASGNGEEGGVTSAGALKRRCIVAGHKSAITFASQIVNTETLRNQNDFGDLVRGLNVYGYATVKPEALTYAVVA